MFCFIIYGLPPLHWLYIVGLPPLHYGWRAVFTLVVLWLACHPLIMVGDPTLKIFVKYGWLATLTLDVIWLACHTHYRRISGLLAPIRQPY